MFLFIESIKLKEGKIYHLSWHQKRVNQTFAAKFPNQQRLDLASIIQAQNLPQSGLYKIRIVYDDSSYTIQIQPYQKKIIESIALIEVGFQYPFKSSDRNLINQTVQQSKADEVIFCNNGYITDSSYSNIVLYDGTHWVTPDTFLLNGTTRQRLIQEHKISEIPIRTEDFYQFQKIGFINALNDLGEQVMDIKVTY